MNKLITQDKIAKTVRKYASQAAEVKLAVSYCGQNGSDFLPEQHRPILQCLVDLSPETVRRGLSSPSGVGKLCRMGEVRSLEKLHSKVLIFDNRWAIVGSNNFSESALHQEQCSILTNDAKFISELLLWFKKLWGQGTAVSEESCSRLQHLAPKNLGVPKYRTRKLKPWKEPLPDSNLERGSFECKLTTRQFKQALHLFRTHHCGYYPKDEPITCFQGAKNTESKHAALSRKLHILLRRINHWTRKDKEQLFKLAYTNGSRAMTGKSGFLRCPTNKIRESIKYLLLTDNSKVSPLIRFEHMARGPYKLPHMAFAGVSFLMYLYRPKKFAIWNGAVDKGLRNLKIYPKRQFSKHLAQGYQDRMAALDMLKKWTKLKSYAAVDHFVDAFAKKGHLKLK